MDKLEIVEVNVTEDHHQARIQADSRNSIRIRREKKPALNGNTILIRIPAPWFENTLILETLFGFLSLAEIRMCRRVCKLWSEEANLLIVRQTGLFLNKVGFGLSIPQSVLDSTFLTGDYDEDLYCWRNIEVDYDSFRDNVGGLGLVAFVSKHCKNIEELTFQAKLDSARLLSAMLKNLQFSSIKKICIYKIVDLSTAPTTPTPYFPVMPTIQTLELSARTIWFDVPDQSSPFHPIFQELIKKSPNLEQLRIEENFYPNLTSCKKLKSLECIAFPFPVLPPKADTYIINLLGFREDVQIYKPSQMARQVRHSLEELVLGICVTDINGIPVYDPPQRYDEQIEADIIRRARMPGRHPKMDRCIFPKLSSLVLDQFDAYLYGCSDYSQDQLPALKKFTILEGGPRSGRYLDILYLAMRKNRSVWKSVEYLELALFPYDHRRAQFRLQRIAKIFPNVKEFHVALSTCGTCLTEKQNERAVLAFFKQLANKRLWKLEGLTLRVRFRTTLAKMVRAVEAAKFTCLQNLQFRFMGPEDVPDNGDTHFAVNSAITKVKRGDGYVLEHVRH